MNILRFGIAVLSLATVLVVSGCGTEKLGKDKNLNTTDSSYSTEVSAAGIGGNQNDAVDRAAGLIQQGRLDEAQTILKTVLRQFARLMPENEGKTYVCFNNDEDYREYLAHLQPARRKQVVRVQASYAQALQLTAFIASGRHEWDTALNYLNIRMAVAPDDMGPYVEKGYILHAQGKSQQAFETYKKGYELGRVHHAVDFERAMALRGMGSTLIDLGRLDEAEADYNKSLQLDPDNPIALSELGYIKKLKAQRK